MDVGGFELRTASHRKSRSRFRNRSPSPDRSRCEPSQTPGETAGQVYGSGQPLRTSRACTAAESRAAVQVRPQHVVHPQETGLEIELEERRIVQPLDQISVSNASRPQRADAADSGTDFEPPRRSPVPWRAIRSVSVRSARLAETVVMTASVREDGAGAVERHGAALVESPVDECQGAVQGVTLLRTLAQLRRCEPQQQRPFSQALGEPIWNGRGIGGLNREARREHRHRFDDRHLVNEHTARTGTRDHLEAACGDEAGA